MTNAELKDALMDGRLVRCKGIEYKCVDSIIYNNVGGKIAVAAELLDKNSNCIVRVQADKVQNLEDQND